MESEFQFIYKEEFWFISTFINTNLIDSHQKSEEIENLIVQKLSTFSDVDIYWKELKDDLFDIVKNISIKCKWVPYLENFPYRDENTDRYFDMLGFFQFDVEYYKDDPSKKEKMRPMLIQQIPYIVLNILRDFSKKEENEGLYLDVESPIYVFVISNKSKPKEISWNQENIELYKRTIGYWTEIYSGQWEDYSDALHTRRIQNNLSNRLSELHFIRRNSGFVYMVEENYERFFESYMKDYVLDPTPKMRTVLFALRSINESLDSLFLKTLSEEFIDLETIENKIKNLRYLRGIIQTKLSLIYNELDYNRRQHYTRVLRHLLEEYDINNIINRVNEKFDVIYNSMEELYRKKSEEIQARTERGLNLLNLLFGAGVLADLAGVIVIALSLREMDLFSITLHGIIAIVMIGILILTIGYYVYMKMGIKESKIGRTVDAVIEDSKGNVVLVKRKYPPFKDYYALPGGFIEKGENKKRALIREVKEETYLDVEIVGKIGIYSEPGRDPRGRIQSTAFKCVVLGDTFKMKAGDDSLGVELISKKHLKEIDLAFDHKKILKDANIL